MPLSLLDATTANFGLTSAIWLFEPPTSTSSDFDLYRHLEQSLLTALNAYPKWCGHLKSVTTLASLSEPGTQQFPSHACRFGRVYAHFGTQDDPGVEFITAASTATLDDLHPLDRPHRVPLWNRQDENLRVYSPDTEIAHALKPNESDEHGQRNPVLAIQVTKLACGGFALALKIAHPLADISALTQFLKDWGAVSRAMLRGEPAAVLDPVFSPSMVDRLAAGDINSEEPDGEILERAMNMPMNRYDWWAAPGSPPNVFQGQDLKPAGKPMPWQEWDVKAPLSSYVVHLTKEQVDYLWEEARRDQPEAMRVSKHDAILAHIWSCIVRARGLEADDEPVHCDLTLGLRPALQLGDRFIGSPIIMLNIEMAASRVAATRDGHPILSPTTKCIRDTILKGSDGDGLAAHLHGVAYEKSPQRIWHGFLGQRHTMVTTWARAGIYELDFGFVSSVRYVDGDVPNLDGCVLIKEAPPTSKRPVSGVKPTWTDNGVDISIPLRVEDMERLLKDPLLLPKVTGSR